MKPAAAEFGAAPSAPKQSATTRTLALSTAIAIMIGITAWPGALTTPGGGADHLAAMALFWAMSAGFVSGVGFRPRFFAWRWLLSGAACAAGIALALLRLQLAG